MLKPSPQTNWWLQFLSIGNLVERCVRYKRGCLRPQTIIICTSLISPSILLVSPSNGWTNGLARRAFHAESL